MVLPTDHMLTTIDNPFNPFTQFDEWYSFDTLHGYDTLGILARVCVTSDELSDADQSQAIEDAIDEIVTENVYGHHIKVEASTVIVPRQVSNVVEAS